jgi:hypothetical protein
LADSALNAPATEIDPLWKDVFLFHFREESRHAILDETEWLGEDQRLDAAQARPGGRRIDRSDGRGGRHRADAGQG